MNRPYRAGLQAVVLDWAGTTVDHGSLAPMRVLQKIFADREIEITEDEARRDMGVLKKDHIRSLLRHPRIAREWERRYQKSPGEDTVETLFADFLPQQMKCLVECSTVIAGVSSAVQRMRDRGLKIGSTTGYTRPLLEVLLAHAASQGYVPDCALCPDDVGAGRPLPWMLYENAVRMKVFPLVAVVKVGDTISDIEEGLNAGTWAVAVARTGNTIGLTEEQWCALPPGERAERLQTAYRQLLDAGAHYVVDTLADLDPVLDRIEVRLRTGERP
ncbi:MAG TPA: phosphonoacetaldehyde hydrolase [Terriglobales bacterium]|nr:phosphonoacetaldehyde hydrolase [Terriglobales bacterium]